MFFTPYLTSIPTPAHTHIIDPLLARPPRMQSNSLYNNWSQKPRTLSNPTRKRTFQSYFRRAGEHSVRLGLGSRGEASRLPAGHDQEAATDPGLPARAQGLRSQPQLHRVHKLLQNRAQRGGNTRSVQRPEPESD